MTDSNFNKKYQASQQLIDIFLANGFKDMTKQKYPDHYGRAEREGYKPTQMKRVLSVGPKSEVLFDYTHIIPNYRGGCSGGDQRYELTEDELRSIITFFLLPAQTRTALKRSHVFIPDLHKKYYAIKEHPTWYKLKMDLKLVELFEGIIII